MRLVDVCQDCGLEQDARDRGKEAPCPNDRVPPHLIETAERFDLLSAPEHAEDGSPDSSDREERATAG